MASSEESREEAKAFRAWVDSVSFAGNVRPKMAPDFDDGEAVDDDDNKQETETTTQANVLERRPVSPG
jgi:hypothetical protein